MKVFFGIVVVVGLSLAIVLLIGQNLSNTAEALDQNNHMRAIAAALKSDPLFNDPDSVQVINWTVFDVTADSWRTSTTFRAKNGFGDYIVSHARINCINGKAKIEYTR
jgi:hypothetical protein